MQSDLVHEWVGIARDFLERACSEREAPNLERLAAQYGYHVVPVDTFAEVCTFANVITYCRAVSVERQRRHIAHELGHVALSRAGYAHPDDDVAADFIAAAIICPEFHFKAALRRHRWDLGELTRVFRCSWELAARRIADVRSAIVTIWDEGSISTRVQSHWIQAPYAAKIERFERAMIAEAETTAGHVYRSDLCRAWWVPGNDGWKRVILVIGLEEFEAEALADRRNLDASGAR